VLADIATQVAETYFEIDDSAELAQLAMDRSWRVVYAAPGGLATLAGQEVTEDDLPMLTALLEELFESDPVAPYDLEALVDGAVRRVASVNTGALSAEEE
jgi:hypothetical protein